MMRTSSGGALAPLPLSQGRFPRQISVFSRRGVKLSPLAQRFMDVLREVARQQSIQGGKMTRCS